MLARKLNFLLSYIIDVLLVEEIDDIFENLICVEFVSEKKQILESLFE
jgi:hypothetical protein